MDDDEELPLSVEEQMLDYARRQTKALETVVLLFEITLFVGVVVAMLWLIALLGS